MSEQIEEVVEKQSIIDMDKLLAEIANEKEQKVKVLDKEALFKLIDNYRFKLLFYVLDTSTDIKIDGTEEDLTEEKVINIFGHQGMVARKSEIDGLWEVINHFGKEYPTIQRVSVIRDRSPACALIRAALERLTGQDDSAITTEAMFVSLWKEVNGVKEDPRLYSEEDIKRIADEAGIDVEELKEVLEPEPQLKEIN